ncbi:ABC transporter ATP-binding protein [Oceanobacillus jeddahense]|uniref:ABC transporter ATP-binding protein n=1 Tax=Oceanobacillus jeddahense TaxID=1462527 RepID=A0ABY5JPH7_9BACI|nr:ABC transporter ATP-binding protein [Oceanobacillus jeddahense]UUI01073.1 ABC transporter ATP-binding protein [Oceanobacillus jeddahense]
MGKLISDQLSLQIGQKNILHKVSLTAHDGELIGLIGPNGSGKSTWIRAMSSLLPYHDGKVMLKGKEITSFPPRDIAKMISYVPQSISLNFDFPVRDIVLMGRHAHVPRFGLESDKDYKIAEAAMHKTNIDHLANCYVNQLSGGQLQLVFIAKVLAQETDILILDEPTSSLDINRQLQMLELVKQLTKEGITVIAALHDLNLAARFCDKLVLLKNGEVLATGNPENVLTADHIYKSYNVQSAVRYDPLIEAYSVTVLTH